MPWPVAHSMLRLHDGQLLYAAIGLNPRRVVGDTRVCMHEHACAMWTHQNRTTKFCHVSCVHALQAFNDPMWAHTPRLMVDCRHGRGEAAPRFLAPASHFSAIPLIMQRTVPSDPPSRTRASDLDIRHLHHQAEGLWPNAWLSRGPQ